MPRTISNLFSRAWRKLPWGGKDGIRGWVNRHPRPVLGTAAALSLVSLIVIALSLRTAPAEKPPEKAWFYDLHTHKLFTADRRAIPPIPGPSGQLTREMPSGVRAHIFTCGECGHHEQFIGYLELYAKKARTSMENLTRGSVTGTPTRLEQPALEALSSGTFVKRPHDPIDGWVRLKSEAGLAILGEINDRCPDGNPPRSCEPGSG